MSFIIIMFAFGSLKLIKKDENLKNDKIQKQVVYLTKELI